MARKPKSRDVKRHEQETAVSEATAMWLGCTVETADDLRGRCETRIDAVTEDLRLAQLAHEVWSSHAKRAKLLVPLIEKLIAEHQRHARAIEALGKRLQVIADGEHQHLDDDAIDPEHVRRMLFPPAG